ncbi:MAG: hypothetical protein ABSE43_08210 [Steroidobacteraceae bacterium]|jgi:hypothetical protein
MAGARLASFGLEDGPTAPVLAALPLPPADELNVLTTLEEVRRATNTVAASGQRLISIFTPDLEPTLYDQAPFLEIIKRFVLGHSFAKVRVLVRDNTRFIGSANRFISMSRRLTSYLEVRLITPKYRDLTASYCIADDRGIVYRLHASRWDGIAAFNSPPIAHQYLLEFDAIWQAAAEQHEQRLARF